MAKAILALARSVNYYRKEHCTLKHMPYNHSYYEARSAAMFIVQSTDRKPSPMFAGNARCIKDPKG
jgi:hypothetical protein